MKSRTLFATQLSIGLITILSLSLVPSRSMLPAASGESGEVLLLQLGENGNGLVVVSGLISPGVLRAAPSIPDRECLVFQLLATGGATLVSWRVADPRILPGEVVRSARSPRLHPLAYGAAHTFSVRMPWVSMWGPKLAGGC